jgi:hypothetical protein
MALNPQLLSHIPAIRSLRGGRSNREIVERVLGRAVPDACAYFSPIDRLMIANLCDCNHRTIESITLTKDQCDELKELGMLGMHAYPLTDGSKVDFLGYE